MLIAHYQGRSYDNDGTPTMTETFRGTEQEAREFADSLIPNVSTDASGVYTVTKVSVRQADGAYWDATVSYRSRIVDGVLAGDASGPTKHSLSVAITEAPLSEHPDYHVNWDHFLAAREDQENYPKNWFDGEGQYDDQKSPIITDPQYKDKFRWCKSLAEIAALPKVTEGGRQLAFRALVKPEIGVNGRWLRPIYYIREYTLHDTAEAAGWAATNRAGKTETPVRGTFGIVGGDWLNYGGEISEEGKRHRAAITYRHHPDGWNGKLYS